MKILQQEILTKLTLGQIPEAGNLHLTNHVACCKSGKAEESHYVFFGEVCVVFPEVLLVHCSSLCAFLTSVIEINVHNSADSVQKLLKVRNKKRKSLVLNTQV